MNLPGAARQRDRLGPVAYRPLVYPFEVPGTEAKKVTISMRTKVEEGNHERVGLLNRAELYREP